MVFKPKGGPINRKIGGNKSMAEKAINRTGFGIFSNIRVRERPIPPLAQPPQSVIDATIDRALGRKKKKKN